MGRPIPNDHSEATMTFGAPTNRLVLLWRRLHALCWMRSMDDPILDLVFSCRFGYWSCSSASELAGKLRVSVQIYIVPPWTMGMIAVPLALPLACWFLLTFQH